MKLVDDAMDGWQARLIEVLKGQVPRAGSMRALSAKIDQGPNYVSQAVKSGEVNMTLSTFVGLLRMTGPAAAFYVLFGMKITDPAAKMIIEAALGVPPQNREEEALARVRALNSPAGSQSPGESGSRPVAPPPPERPE